MDLQLRTNLQTSEHLEVLLPLTADVSCGWMFEFRFSDSSTWQQFAVLTVAVFSLYEDASIDWDYPSHSFIDYMCTLLSAE